MTATEAQERAIRQIARTLEPDPRVRALFLSGSHGNGMADAWSDIDFVLITELGATDDIAALWRQAVAATGEIVLWWDRSPVPVLINAITDDWTRTDVVILKRAQLSAQPGVHAQDTLKPLIDRDGLHGTLPATPIQAPPSPARLLRQIQDFIRILGLLHLAAGRGEYINGVLGVFHLRNHLVELMIDETAAPNRGGILHLNRLLTDDQKAVLTALPPPVPERDAMIAGHLAYAAAYLPRARRRARAPGLDWPERFEAVTWERLHTTLGIARPYDPA